MTPETSHDGTADDTRHRPRDYWPEVSALVAADAKVALDIGMRWATVAAGALALWYAIGMNLPLIWAASYICIDSAYVAIMRRYRAPVGPVGYAAALGLNILTSCLFASMPYYLITTEQVGLTFIGVCGFLGLCVHNLVRHQGLTHVAISDILLMGLGAILIIWVFTGYSDNFGQKLLVIVGVGALSAYFGVAYLSSLRIRGRLSNAETIKAEAQKMEAVGRLTGGVAHDFNNILTVILGNLDLYQELDTREDRDTVVREVQIAAHRAANLTAQLLSFSRRATLRPESVELAVFLPSLGAMFRRTLPATITLAIDPGPPGLRCQADPNQLSTALLNLVINARDAMPEGGQIMVTARPRGLPDCNTPHRSDGIQLSGSFCAITVHDTGPGIPEAIIEEAKAPFFTTKPLGKGSGLGLSMVLGFAEQTEGALTLRNRPQCGLEAILVLPQGELDATQSLTEPTGVAD